MPSAKEIFESQRKLAEMKSALSALQNELYEYANKGQGGTLCDPLEISENSLQVVELKMAVAKAESAMTASHDEIGGKVYRIPAANLLGFDKKIGKLNRKATALGCEEIAYVPYEIEEEKRDELVYLWHYVVLQGSTPMVPGYKFIAALDHTVQEHDGDPLIIKQVPGQDEEVDLNGYRHADARCDHCNKIRSRNTTYLVQETATGKISKVGSSCLRDFTGANDPEKVASYMEYLLEFIEEANGEGDNYGSGRKAYEVATYLTHVACKIRTSGWEARSASSFATADQAWANIYGQGKFNKDGSPQWVDTTDEDAEIAQKSIEWAQGLEGTSEFEGNLKVMAGLKYMPAKGDGIVAYIVQGFVKDESKRVEREAEEARKAAAKPVPVTEDRVEITGAIIKEYTTTNEYGTTEKMTVLDDRGFTVNGTVPSSIYAARLGDRVTFFAKLDLKPTDKYFAWYKRPTKAKIIKEAVND